MLHSKMVLTKEQIGLSMATVGCPPNTDRKGVQPHTTATSKSETAGPSTNRRLTGYSISISIRGDEFVINGGTPPVTYTIVIWLQ